ncbi:MAG: TetR/AcrR family transcriptional regulator [Pseudomonadota bacterium]
MKDSSLIKKYKKSEDTVEKILEAAVDLFYEHGFTKASTRQLLGRAGMSSSAIYNHFSNKEEILFTIIHRASDKVLQLLKKLNSQYDDPEECLRQMISQMLHLFGDEPMRKEIAIFIDELYQLPPNLREICNRQHRKIYDIYKNKILEIKLKNRKKEAKCVDTDDAVTAFGVIGAMLWVYHWYKDDGRLPMEKISEQLLNLLFNGLKKVT